jgi:hypothetical protein
MPRLLKRNAEVGGVQWHSLFSEVNAFCSQTRSRLHLEVFKYDKIVPFLNTNVVEFYAALCRQYSFRIFPQHFIPCGRN